MSNFLFYLKVKPFIGQWLIYHYGNPVTFPNGSDENDCIHLFIRKRPKNADASSIGKPELTEEEKQKYMLLPFTIPECRAKPVETYNYMSPMAGSALLEVIEWRFNNQLWKDLKDAYEKKFTLLKAVRGWCIDNGIDIDYDYTIKMRLQRKKKRHLKYGVDTRRANRVNDEDI